MVRIIDWIMFILGCLALVTVMIMACYNTTPKKESTGMTRQELKIDMELFCNRKISDTDPTFLVTWHYYQKGNREGRKAGSKAGYKHGYEKGYEQGAFMKPIENGGKRWMELF